MDGAKMAGGEVVGVNSLTGELWVSVKDGNRYFRWMLNRHYSARKYKDNRKVRLSVGPGNKLLLMTVDGQAIFAWRKFIDDAVPKQTGVNCAVFRNEGDYLSSNLILEAEKIAWKQWPGERLYTYVDETKLPQGKRPGYCFECAGWIRLPYRTKSGKLVFEKQELSREVVTVK